MALTITIRFFAVAREWTGQRVEAVSFDDGATTDTVWEHLLRREPRFESWRQRIRLAVNDQYVTAPVALRPGDEVAVIPPVSGG